MTIAQEAHTTREQRALALFRKYGERIEQAGESLYYCPSQDGERFYRVVYPVGEGEGERCQCGDWTYRGQFADAPCVHILAVALSHAKSRRRLAVPEQPPCACNGGWATIGQEATDPETGEEVERIEALPCRRCADNR
jgi:hypothetical protein